VSIPFSMAYVEKAATESLMKRAKDDQPFFLSVNFHEGCTQPKLAHPDFIHPIPAPRSKYGRTQRRASCQGWGRLWNKVRELGLEEDTLIFWGRTDNGGLAGCYPGRRLHPVPRARMGTVREGTIGSPPLPLGPGRFRCRPAQGTTIFWAALI